MLVKGNEGSNGPRHLWVRLSAAPPHPSPRLQGQTFSNIQGIDHEVCEHAMPSDFACVRGVGDAALCGRIIPACVASGPSGPGDSDIVPVNKLEKDVAAQDKLADDAAKKLRADKEKLKAAKADLAQQLTEAADAMGKTHGAAEDALDPKFGKLLNGAWSKRRRPRLLLS